MPDFHNHQQKKNFVKQSWLEIKHLYQEKRQQQLVVETALVTYVFLPTHDHRQRSKSLRDRFALSNQRKPQAIGAVI